MCAVLELMLMCGVNDVYIYINIQIYVYVHVGVFNDGCDGDILSTGFPIRTHTCTTNQPSNNNTTINKVVNKQESNEHTRKQNIKHQASSIKHQASSIKQQQQQRTPTTQRDQIAMFRREIRCDANASILATASNHMHNATYNKRKQQNNKQQKSRVRTGGTNAWGALVSVKKCAVYI